VVTWFLSGQAVASAQITKRLLDSLKPGDGEYFVWDGSLAGFGVRVQSTGARSYVVKYRAGSGRGAPTRRLTLGKVGTLTPDEARTLAKKMLGSVAHGADPAAQRAADKRASTLAEVAEQFFRNLASVKPTRLHLPKFIGFTASTLTRRTRPTGCFVS
jgi:Arm domain-containing DNA-binding protein